MVAQQLAGVSSSPSVNFLLQNSVDCYTKGNPFRVSLFYLFQYAIRLMFVDRSIYRPFDG